MRIQSLQIRNFKGLKDFQIQNLPNLVVLTGANGGGKTSILGAISRLKETILSPHRQLNNSKLAALNSQELVYHNSDARVGLRRLF